MNKEKTLQLFDTLVKQQDNLFSTLSQMDASKFSKKETKDSWNILQVLKHLQVSEKSSLDYLLYKAKDPNATYTKTGLKEKFNTWVLKKRMASPKKIQAPDVKGLSPTPDGLEYDKIIREWKETRNNLHSFLKASGQDKYALNLYKHPAIGRINLSQMLEFFYGHIQRHEKQIDRILAS